MKNKRETKADRRRRQAREKYAAKRLYEKALAKLPNWMQHMVKEVGLNPSSIQCSMSQDNPMIEVFGNYGAIELPSLGPIEINIKGFLKYERTV